MQMHFFVAFFSISAKFVVFCAFVCVLFSLAAFRLLLGSFFLIWKNRQFGPILL